MKTKIFKVGENKYRKKFSLDVDEILVYFTIGIIALLLCAISVCAVLGSGA